MLLAAIALSLGLAVGLNVNPPLASAASAMASAATSLATAAGVPSRDSLWLPSAGTTWQIVLQNPVKVSSLAASPQAQAYDIDMFGNSADTISALQSKAIKVICYFSAGTYESYRPDSSQFTPADMGKQLGAWAGEYWLNVSSPNVRNIMAARIRMAAWKGCDAIDPDNMDGYGADNGLGLTQQQAIDYMSFLSSTAQQYNMTTGLKNAGEIIPNVLPMVQFSINEECAVYNECNIYQPFITANKPVFRIEYPAGAPGSVDASKLKSLCTASGSDGMSLAIKDMNLDGWVEYCDGTSANTTTTTG